MGFILLISIMLHLSFKDHLLYYIQAQGLEGSIAHCTEEGETVYVPYISDDPCIRCFCQDSIVKCSHEVCPPTEGCHMLLFDRAPDSCCQTCKGCTHNGIHYDSGSEWQTPGNPCQNNYCHAGVITTSHSLCHVVCDHPILLADRCCPVCKGCIVDGVNYAENERFIAPLDPCSTCICQNKTVHCRRNACPTLNCIGDEIIHPAGQCCPMCKGKHEVFNINDKVCLFMSKIYMSNGSTHSPDSCTNCRCTEGTMVCDRFVCPRAPCKIKNLEWKPGICCPTCKKKKRKCKHRNRKYKDGSEWQPDMCTTCSCSDGTIHCQVQQCPKYLNCPTNQKPSFVKDRCCPQCKAVNAVCAVFGDPHYRTFDGHIYNFQGRCNYLLSRDCRHGNYSIAVHNEARQTKVFSWTKSVQMHVQGIRIVLQQDLRIKVNQMKVLLPFVKKGVLEISESGHTVTVDTSVGVKLVWDGQSYVEVEVSPDYQGHLCGLCGNFNHDVSDEYTGSDGIIYDDIRRFGETWRIGRKRPGCGTNEIPQLDVASLHRVEFLPKSSRHLAPEERPTCEYQRDPVKLNRAKRDCGHLKENIYAACRLAVNVQPYYESCLEDMCECPEADGMNCACQSIKAYTRACEREDIKIRGSNICDDHFLCEGIEVYKDCVSACGPVTCDNRHSKIGCNRPCRGSCSCPTGYVSHNQSCIRVSQCPDNL